MANEQKTAKIRAALEKLDPKDDTLWTDDGLPRENAVRTLANDQSISRKDIQEAHPGFQRNALKPAPAPNDIDPITGEPVVTVSAIPGSGTGVVESDADPTKNTGELMTDAEVRAILEQRLKLANEELVAAQQMVREANNRVLKSQNGIVAARETLTREFPPMTAAQNVKEYIASEMAQRARAHGVGEPGVPGSRIDAAMSRQNSRGWRRPSRTGQVQTGAARVVA